MSRQVEFLARGLVKGQLPEDMQMKGKFRPHPSKKMSPTALLKMHSTGGLSSCTVPYGATGHIKLWWSFTLGLIFM